MKNGEQTTWQKAMAGALGLIIMALAVWGYFWTEGQRTGATRTLAEILESYIDRSAVGSSTSKVYPYVYVHGQAESEEILVDDLFGLKLRALFLERRIERVERRVSTPEGIRTVTYNWVPFAEPPFNAYYRTPDPLEVSGLTLSSQLLDWRLKGEQIRCDDARFQVIPPFRGKALFCRSDGFLSNQPEGEVFGEGDIRISIYYLPLRTVSTISRLSKGALYPIEDKNRNYLYILEPGKKTPEELVEIARSRITKTGNIGRGFCIGIFLLGLFFFSSLFKPSKR